jgi:hypothetical protein
MSDATDSFIAAWRAVPDRASAVPDRCHRGGQPAVRRRISDSTRARPEGVLRQFPAWFSCDTVRLNNNASSAAIHCDSSEDATAVFRRDDERFGTVIRSLKLKSE